LPKKNKQQQEMEQQLKSFAGSTAGSVVIAVGIGVVALPYAMKYLVKNAEEQAIPWAMGFGKNFYDEYTGTIKAALKKLEADQWHEANPDVTQADIDVPARSGDPYTDYLKQVGLPLSTVLVLFGDKEALSVYQHSGEWNMYGTRQINGQHYYIVVPKGIKVYYKLSKDIWVADIDGVCPPGFKTTTKDADGFALPPGAIGCTKTITDNLVVSPSVWP